MYVHGSFLLQAGNAPSELVEGATGTGGTTRGRSYLSSLHVRQTGLGGNLCFDVSSKTSGSRKEAIYIGKCRPLKCRRPPTLDGQRLLDSPAPSTSVRDMEMMTREAQSHRSTGSLGGMALCESRWCCRIVPRLGETLEFASSRDGPRGRARPFFKLG